MAVVCPPVPGRSAAGRWGRCLVRFVVRIPASLLIGTFRIWQLLASPTYGQTCRFYPSCSAYGLEAVRTHGAVRGVWLTLRRLVRCHPWNPGGVDPVPPRGRHDAHRDDEAGQAGQSAGRVTG